MRGQVLFSVLASLPLFTGAIHAECVGLTAKEVLSKPTIPLIFSGRVTDITDLGKSGARATIEVQRVWKGSVPAHIDVYFRRLAPERPRFAMSAYAVVLATPLSSSLRNAAGLADRTPPTEYEALGCTDAFEPGFEKNLGVSHEPKR